MWMIPQDNWCWAGCFVDKVIGVHFLKKNQQQQQNITNLHLSTFSQFENELVLIFPAQYMQDEQYAELLGDTWF